MSSSVSSQPARSRFFPIPQPYLLPSSLTPSPASLAQLPELRALLPPDELHAKRRNQSIVLLTKWERIATAATETPDEECDELDIDTGKIYRNGKLLENLECPRLGYSHEQYVDSESEDEEREGNDDDDDESEAETVDGEVVLKGDADESDDQPIDVDRHIGSAVYQGEGERDTLDWWGADSRMEIQTEHLPAAWKPVEAAAASREDQEELQAFLAAEASHRVRFGVAEAQNGEGRVDLSKAEDGEETPKGKGKGKEREMLQRHTIHSPKVWHPAGEEDEEDELSLQLETPTRKERYRALTPTQAAAEEEKYAKCAPPLHAYVPPQIPIPSPMSASTSTTSKPPHLAQQITALSPDGTPSKKRRLARPAHERLMDVSARYASGNTSGDEAHSKDSSKLTANGSLAFCSEAVVPSLVSGSSGSDEELLRTPARGTKRRKVDTNGKGKQRELDTDVEEADPYSTSGTDPTTTTTNNTDVFDSHPLLRHPSPVAQVAVYHSRSMRIVKVPERLGDWLTHNGTSEMTPAGEKPKEKKKRVQGPKLEGPVVDAVRHEEERMDVEEMEEKAQQAAQVGGEGAGVTSLVNRVKAVMVLTVEPPPVPPDWFVTDRVDLMVRVEETTRKEDNVVVDQPVERQEGVEVEATARPEENAEMTELSVAEGPGAPEATVEVEGSGEMEDKVEMAESMEVEEHIRAEEVTEFQEPVLVEAEDPADVEPAVEGQDPAAEVEDGAFHLGAEYLANLPANSARLEATGLRCLDRYASTEPSREGSPTPVPEVEIGAPEERVDRVEEHEGVDRDVEMEEAEEVPTTAAVTEREEAYRSPSPMESVIEDQPTGEHFGAAPGEVREAEEVREEETEDGARAEGDDSKDLQNSTPQPEPERDPEPLVTPPPPAPVVQTPVKQEYPTPLRLSRRQYLESDDLDPLAMNVIDLTEDAVRNSPEPGPSGEDVKPFLLPRSVRNSTRCVERTTVIDEEDVIVIDDDDEDELAGFDVNDF